MDAERARRVSAARAKARKSAAAMTKVEEVGLTAAALADPDNPPLEGAFWKSAKPMSTDRLARYRGQRGSQRTPVKRATSIRLDADVVEHFRATGPGWQSRINKALRKVAGLD